MTLFNHKNSRGFTLIELVVAVSVVGILAAIAYPSYLSQSRKSRRSDALGSLTAISSSLERCYAAAYTYTGCSTIPAGATASQSGYYTIATAVTASTYTLTATPVGAQAADTTCESFVLTNTSQQALSNTGTDDTSVCWGTG